MGRGIGRMHFCEVTQFCIASLLANIGSLSLLVPSVAEMSMTDAVEFTPLEDFEFWLEEMEDKLVASVKKPKNRVEACQLLSTAKKLRSECKKKEKPVGLMDEDNPKAVELKARFDAVASTVTDNVAKAETLCICWDKLNDDVQELTKALSSGGADKLTIDKLETSINQLRNMFKERTNIIENLTPAKS